MIAARAARRKILGMKDQGNTKETKGNVAREARRKIERVNTKEIQSKTKELWRAQRARDSYGKNTN